MAKPLRASLAPPAVAGPVDRGVRQQRDAAECALPTVGYNDDTADELRQALCELTEGIGVFAAAAESQKTARTLAGGEPTN